MPKYVIERNMPGAGQMSADDLRSASQKSNEVLATMMPRAQWQQSYVTDDKLFCVYVAEDPEGIREHAAKAGFPVDSVRLISAVIDPTTGD